MSVEKQPQDKSVEATEALTNNLPNGCVIGELHAAPQGQWMAVQVNCTDKGFVQVMHAASGQIRSIGANLGQDSFFLDWMPSGNEVILKVDTVGTPRIYRVNLANDKAESLPVPATTYDVAISPNGKRMIYSLTRGLGYGGETWIAGTNGQNAKRVLVDPTHITAFARWSPSGNQIAYIVMPDSNIPFTVGDLWIMDAVGNNSVLLGEVDTGHGYPPVWSPDGSQIAFVGRENRNDKKADHLADRLISNIYTVNVKDRTVSAVTQFTDALTESPVWSPDGELLAFSTNAGGSAGVWVFGAEDKTLRRMTFGISALHPAWLPEK
jgi:Tol biopolymer transport system component